jgi:hypothetical protein
MLEGRIVGILDIVTGGVVAGLVGVGVGSEPVKVEISMIKVLVDGLDEIPDEGSGIESVFESVNLGVVSGVDDGSGIVFVSVSVNLEMDSVNVSLLLVSLDGSGRGVVERDAVVESSLGIWEDKAVDEEKIAFVDTVLLEAGVGAEVLMMVLDEVGLGFGEISLKPVSVLIAVNSCAGGLEEVEEIVVPSSDAEVTDWGTGVLDVDEDFTAGMGEIAGDVEFKERLVDGIEKTLEESDLEIVEPVCDALPSNVEVPLEIDSVTWEGDVEVEIVEVEPLDGVTGSPVGVIFEVLLGWVEAPEVDAPTPAAGDVTKLDKMLLRLGVDCDDVVFESARGSGLGNDEVEVLEGASTDVGSEILGEIMLGDTSDDADEVAECIEVDVLEGDSTDLGPELVGETLLDDTSDGVDNVAELMEVGESACPDDVES